MKEPEEWDVLVRFGFVRPMPPPHVMDTTLGELWMEANPLPRLDLPKMPLPPFKKAPADHCHACGQHLNHHTPGLRVTHRPFEMTVTAKELKK